MADYSIADELKKLKELYDCGVLTEEEFSEAKSRIIQGTPTKQNETPVSSKQEKEERPNGKPFRYLGYQGKTISIRCDSCQTDLSMPVDSFTQIGSSSCVAKCEITCPRCSNRVVSGYKMVKPDMPLPEEPCVELPVSISNDKTKRVQATYTPQNRVQVKLGTYHSVQNASISTNGKTIWNGKTGQIIEFTFDRPTSVKIKYQMGMFDSAGSCEGIIDPKKSKKWQVVSRPGLMTMKLSLQPVDVFTAD